MGDRRMRTWDTAAMGMGSAKRGLDFRKKGLEARYEKFPKIYLEGTKKFLP
jgi:hypothetical protein